jgi:hypothetical protein
MAPIHQTNHRANLKKTVKGKETVLDWKFNLLYNLLEMLILLIKIGTSPEDLENRKSTRMFQTLWRMTMEINS